LARAVGNIGYRPVGVSRRDYLSVRLAQLFNSGFSSESWQAVQNVDVRPWAVWPAEALMDGRDDHLPVLSGMSIAPSQATLAKELNTFESALMLVPSKYEPIEDLVDEYSEIATGQAVDEHDEIPRVFLYDDFARVFPALRWSQHVLSQLEDDGGQRLLIASTDVYGEYDRARSEAELRDAIVFPGLFALVVLAISVRWESQLHMIAVVLAALIVLAMLFFQARAQDRSARHLLARATANGIISTRLIDQVNAQNAPAGWTDDMSRQIAAGEPPPGSQPP
jgi:hypothetical protein